MESLKKFEVELMTKTLLKERIAVAKIFLEAIIGVHIIKILAGNFRKI